MHLQGSSYPLLCFILFTSFSSMVFAQGQQVDPIPQIRVGGYQFAPYVNLQQDGRYTGLTLDIINALNQVQQDVRFEFVSTSIEHRYKAYSVGRFDMMMFENPNWGWQQIETQFIPLHITDGEAFIALKSKARNQLFFSTLTNKSIALVKGYHYRFAQLETNPEHLEKQFNIIYVNNNKASIESILRKRADVAPVTYSYLNHYLKLNPQEQPLLLISEKWDQHYTHNILLKPNSVLEATKLSHWLQLLTDNGKLAELAQNYDITLTTSD